MLRWSCLSRHGQIFGARSEALPVCDGMEEVVCIMFSMASFPIASSCILIVKVFGMIAAEAETSMFSSRFVQHTQRNGNCVALREYLKPLMLT